MSTRTMQRSEGKTGEVSLSVGEYLAWCPDIGIPENRSDLIIGVYGGPEAAAVEFMKGRVSEGTRRTILASPHSHHVMSGTHVVELIDYERRHHSVSVEVVAEIVIRSRGKV